MYLTYSLPPTKAFTLVELIVVITIIAILSTIWFVAYSWFSSKARDSSRVAQLKSINQALEWYTTRWKLPLPDDKVTIYASWTIIWYQWNAWEAVLNKIWIKEWWKDPNDDKYYTYSIDSKLKNIQLLAFLENDPSEDKEMTYNIKNNDPLLSYWNEVKYPLNKDSITRQSLRDSSFHSEWKIFSFLPIANATDYTARIARPYGSKLWILLDSSNNPIQENINLRTSWLDIVTTTWSYTAVFTYKDKITASWSNLILWFTLRNPDLANFDNSLVLYYDMETTTTVWGLTVLKDFSKYWNYWSLTNWISSWLANWKKWNSINFNWINWYINTPYSSTINNTFPVTISVWIYPIIDQFDRAIISKGWLTAIRIADTWASLLSWSLVTTPNKINIGRQWCGNWASYTSLSINQWHNILLTVDINNTQSLFIDGILDSVAWIGPCWTSDNLFIWGGTWTTFSGNIDEVRIYNRVLSDTEIQSLYNATK